MINNFDFQIIDVQSHIVPKSYYTFLSKRKKAPKIEQHNNRNFLWYADDLAYPIDERVTSVGLKLKDMKRSGIDMQILSIAMPGVDSLNPSVGLRIAKKVNDEISEIVNKYPQNFLGLATLPMQDIGESIDELERASKDLDLRGVEVFSNINGKTLDDEVFFPIYQKAMQLDVPLFIHPTKPLMYKVMNKYGLLGAVGYLFDTTLAILEIVLGGILEKYKKLKIILPHCGSTIPYLIGRIDHQFNINEDSRRKISKPPSEYLKLVYFDTAQTFYKPAFDCCFAFSGKDKLMFGTDYPFANLSKSVHFLDSILKEDSKKDIFCINAKQLFKIV